MNHFDVSYKLLMMSRGVNTVRTIVNFQSDEVCVSRVHEISARVLRKERALSAVIVPPYLALW